MNHFSDLMRILIDGRGLSNQGTVGDLELGTRGTQELGCESVLEHLQDVEFTDSFRCDGLGPMNPKPYRVQGRGFT